MAPSPRDTAKILKQVLDRIDARKLLHLIGYRLDKLEEPEPGQFRGLCPIHKETIFRTLCVDAKAKTYKCTYNFCSGHAGGDLIDLYAKVRQLPEPEAAARELIEKLNLSLVEKTEETDSMKQLEVARNLLELDAAEEALSIYRAVLSRDPFHVDAREGASAAYLRLGDTDAACSELQVAAHARQNDADWEEVARLARRLMELQPRDPDHRRLMIEALHQMGDKAGLAAHQQAMADLLDSLGRLQEATEARIELEESGVVSLESSRRIVESLLDQNREAEALEQASVRMNRFAKAGDEQAIVEILAVLVERGVAPQSHVQRFLEDINRLGLSPELLNRCLRGAQNLSYQGRHAEAMGLLDGIERQARGNVHYMAARVAALEASGGGEAAHGARLAMIDRLIHDGRLPEAAAEAGQMLAVWPGDVEALKRLVRVYEENEQEREAIEICWRIIDELRAQDRPSELLAIYEKLTFFEPDNPSVRQDFILALARAGRRREAGLAAVMLSEELVEAGRGDEAAQRLTVLSERLPGNAELRVALGELLANQGDGPRAAAAYAEAADIRAQEGRVAEAEELGQRAAAADPRNPDLLARVAETLAAQPGKEQEAAERFERLSEVRLEAGDGQGAEDAAARAMELNPGNASPLRALARVFGARQEQTRQIDALLRVAELLASQGRFNDAAEAARDVLKLDPDNLRALELRVDALRADGQAGPAIEACFELSSLFLGRGEFEQAEPVLRRILEMDPPNAAARETLLETLLRLRRPDEAAKIGLEFVEALRRAGDREKAEALLAKLADASPENAPIREAALAMARERGDADDIIRWARELIELRRREGRLGEVVRHWRLLTETSPNSLEFRRGWVDALRESGASPEAVSAETLALARALREAGETNEALRRFQEALSSADDSEEIRLEMAELQAETGDSSAATAAYLAMAERHRDDGDSDAAMAVLRKAIELDKRNPDPRRAFIDLLLEEQRIADAVSAYIELCELYRALDQRDKSLEIIEEAIGVKPDNLALRGYRVEELRAAGRDQEADDAAFKLVDALAKRGEYNKALAEIDKLARDRQDQPPAGLDALRARVEAMRGGKPISAETPKPRLATGPVAIRPAAESRPASPAATTSAAASREEEKAPAAKSSESDKTATNAPAGGTGFRRWGPEREASKLQIVDAYTFESFVVGDENQFAYATALAVSKSPGRQYNPLFIHGNVGVGKTHLMNAIVNSATRSNQDFAVIYTGTDEFISQLVEAIQTNNVTGFRNTYRSTDMLLIDDIQFLSGKERAQEEFFHVFNALFQAGKQIILTSDRPPREIERLQDRLTSRFGAGVIVDMQRPGIETRMAIVRSELERRGMVFKPDVVEAIAQRVEGSVRDLKGAINQLCALAEISGKAITAEGAAKAIDAIFARSR